LPQKGAQTRLSQGRKMLSTIRPGTLTCASAYPDPPFDTLKGDAHGGFDIELMHALCGVLGLTLQPVAYTGSDFNGIFDGLAASKYDAVISGTTITPERAKRVLFSKPYLEFGQGVVVNHELTPQVENAAGLHGLTAGIQTGNTSEIPAKEYLAKGMIAKINFYPYDGITQMLDDLEAGRIGLIIKLQPVLAYLIMHRPKLKLAFTIPTHEKLGIAYALDNVAMKDAFDHALDVVHANGTFAKLQAPWFRA
jgi:polar amino acid transport system substrate-binding protein